MLAGQPAECGKQAPVYPACLQQTHMTGSPRPCWTGCAGIQPWQRAVELLGTAAGIRRVPAGAL